MFKIASSLDDFTSEDLEDWNELSAALKSVEDATNAALEAEKEAADALLAVELEMLTGQTAFYEDILKSITDAYTGSLSYLDSIQKIEYLDNLGDYQLESGDTASYLDTLLQQLGYDKAMTTTKEDYIPIFEKYIDALEDAEYVPEATTADVVEEIELTNEKLDGVMLAIEKASYQGVL